jgi:hypothetical protein
MYTLGKVTFGAVAIAAALAFGGLASTPATAASANGKATSSKVAASDTEFSSHWRYRRYGYYRPYAYRYGYYRPRPYYYRPYAYAGYPYYRPYYRPYYYNPGPVFSIGFGFGPRYYW